MQIKESALEEGGENADLPRKNSVRVTADYSNETLKARRTQNDVFQFLKGNSCQLRLLYPTKLPIVIGEKKIQTFHDKR